MNRHGMSRATLPRPTAYKQSRKDRKKVEMLFAHLKRILKLIACDCAGERRPRRVPAGGHRAESATNGEDGCR